MLSEDFTIKDIRRRELLWGEMDRLYIGSHYFSEEGDWAQITGG